MLTLSDHIAFAIERMQKGVYIHMPSVYELEINYPIEVRIGRKFLAAIRNTLKSICSYYKNGWALDLSEEEKLYLMGHINRVCSKETI